MKRELERGASPSDFTVSLIESSTDVDYIRSREIEEIINQGTLWPGGYNGNAGRFIVPCDSFIEKARCTRQAKKDAGRIYNASKGKHTYKHKDDYTVRLWLDINDDRVKSGEYISLRATERTTPRPVKDEKRRMIAEERLIYGGKTLRRLQAEEACRTPDFKNALVNNTNWKAGRVKLADRLNRGEYTDRELERFKTSAVAVKDHWGTLSKDERIKRTSAGQLILKQRHKCIHCGLETTMANIARWHNDNCKQKESIIES